MIHLTERPIRPASRVERGSLSTAAPSFDWTRRLNPRVRSLVTTWLEIGDRAFRTGTIVGLTGGAR